MINSPRTIKACQELGIIPSELYKISLEEYKSTYKLPLTMDQKIIKMRYDGYEKFRKESITLVQKRREVIIANENNGKKKPKNIKKSKTNIVYIYKSLDNIKNGEKKAIEKFKSQQRKNIKSMLKSQIEEELLKKRELKKEWIQQKREEKQKKDKLENEINNKKAEEEVIERKKKIEEKYQEKEELIIQRLNRQKKMEEQLIILARFQIAKIIMLLLKIQKYK